MTWAYKGCRVGSGRTFFFRERSPAMADFLAAFAATWVIVAPAEIGDKTFFAAMAMGGSKIWRKPAVTLGAVLAFCGTMLLAVLVGGAIATILPPAVKYFVMAVLFLWFAASALRDVLGDGDDEEVEDTGHAQRGFWLQVGQSAALFFSAEFLDKSQFAAATAAGTASNVVGLAGVFAGAWVGITSVVLLGLLGGFALAKKLSPRLMGIIVVLAFTAFGTWAAWMFVQAL
jgi:putative Ca2+/H+ antiporter (TMEM165/GDT1 family)